MNQGKLSNERTSLLHFSILKGLFYVYRRAIYRAYISVHNIHKIQGVLNVMCLPLQ